MKNVNDYKLTRKVTVGQLKQWICLRNDVSKTKIINDVIEHRFTNRYIKHLDHIDSGFLKMAISCLMIETLQSFKQGLKHTKGKSPNVFKKFFQTEQVNFPEFSTIADDFYENIRCGILHQGETTNAWRIVKSGPLLNKADKVINANKFVKALELSIKSYIDMLSLEDWNSLIWQHAIVKLNDICENCKVK